MKTPIQEGTWVTLDREGFNYPTRYVTKLNDDGQTFTDDGRFSKESPSRLCYIKDYKNIEK